MSLPDDALRLLREAAKDKNGIVMSVRTLGGRQIQANKVTFLDHGSPRRAEAHWEEISDLLIERGLLAGSPDGVLELTAEAYRAVDGEAAAADLVI